MPNITLPNFPFVDGAIPTGTDVSENIYDISGGAPNSYEVINGHLDIDNLDASWATIDRTAVQYNVLSLSGEVGATSNLDYVKDLFLGYTPTAADLANPDHDDPATEPARSTIRAMWLGVPGLGINFYLPYRAIVILTWNVMWMNDGVNNGLDQNEQESLLRLFVNGQIQEYTWKRELHPCIRIDQGGPGAGDKTHWGRDINRYWNGHYTVELEAGFHSASVRLLCSSEVPQTRLFNRSMRYIAFHRPSGT